MAVAAFGGKAESAAGKFKVDVFAGGILGFDENFNAAFFPGFSAVFFHFGRVAFAGFAYLESDVEKLPVFEDVGDDMGKGFCRVTFPKAVRHQFHAVKFNNISRVLCEGVCETLAMGSFKVKSLIQIFLNCVCRRHSVCRQETFMILHWETLLSATRYGHPAILDPNRSNFHRDYDRIVFSTAFRRLGRKTQVHPFSVNDHVHSRLTHSIEVSSVSRSLAIAVFNQLQKEFPKNFNASLLGTIAQSAALSHDIGNPPFGHAGEAAIRDWFKRNRDSDPLKEFSDREMLDFENFDGNAQGVRILSKLEYHFLDGGMRLTYPTISSMMKYPRLASYGAPTSLFQTEADDYREMANVLGIPEIGNGVWMRHPLSYLVEAADDICYCILDVEDAIELGILQFADVRNMFEYLCGPDVDIDKEYNENGQNFRDFLSSVRGLAIQNLIDAVALVFVQHYPEIMDGKLQGTLLELADSDAVNGIRIAKRLGRERIYPDRRKTELEVGSYTTLCTVLDAFVGGVYEFRKYGRSSYRGARIVRLIGQSKIGQSVTRLEAYHQVLDFVSGMTDNYASYLAQQISGLVQ